MTRRWSILVVALAASLLVARAWADDAPPTPPGQPVEPAVAPATPAAAGPPAAPGQVIVGAYVNDVQSIDLKLHSYAVDVYLWFRWRPELGAPAPSESVEFVNPSELWGHARSIAYEAPVELPSGELYQVVRVQGRFSRKLPLYSYPFDRQVLTVAFEDQQRDAKELVYVADKVTVSPDLVLPGFRMGEPRLAITGGTYPTDFGDPRHAPVHVYSRASIELPISRPVATYAVKLLLPPLCVVLCSALMLLLRPTWVDARIGIGITALLTIVALQITTNDDLPNVDYLVLMDQVYIGAYIYVIAGLGVVVRTTRMIEPDESWAPAGDGRATAYEGLIPPAGKLAAAVRLDRRVLGILTLGWFVSFVVLVVRAIIGG